MADDFISIEITGLEETIASLRQCKEDVQKKALYKALVDGSVPFVQALAESTPVKSSNLIKHLAVQVKMDSTETGGLATIGFPGAQQVARWVEYGHKEVGHAPEHKEEGVVQPHPFIRPTFETTKDIAVQAFKDSLDSSLADIIKENGLEEAA